MIQDFEPAGLGARDLRECLLIQLSHKKEQLPAKADDSLLRLETAIISDCYEEFTRKHWDKIQQKLGIGEDELNHAIKELCKLNPRPGASLGETVGRSMQQIVPDFIVETEDDGTINLALNNPNVPELRISRDFSEMVEEHTLLTTMQAIIDLQRPFFEEGDESLLRPMILKDVAERAKLDISTISRVSNSKYVQTNYGIYPLKFFFSDSYTKEDGEEMSVREIKKTLKECVDSEDKKSPYTDDELTEMLAAKGYPIARRTVAKYRQQLNIPVARLRK